MKKHRSTAAAEEGVDQLDTRQLLKVTLDSSFNFIQVFKAVRDHTGKITDFTWILTNRHWQQAYGDVTGRSLLELNPTVVPTGVFGRLVEVTETGVSQAHEHYYAFEQFNGWFHQTLTKFQDGAVLTTEDITARRQAEEQQKFLLKLSDALRFNSDPWQVQEMASRLLADYLAACWVYFVEIEADGITAKILNGHTTRAQLLLSPGIRSPDFARLFLAANSGGKTIIYNDVESAPDLNRTDLESFRAIDTRAVVSVPLLKDSRVVALLTVSSPMARSWMNGEISLIEDVARRTWAIVEHAKLEIVLRESEARYRTVFDSLDEGFHISELLFDDAGKPVDWRYVEVNKVFENQTGLFDAPGRLGSLLAPATKLHWLSVYNQVVQTGQPARFEDYHSATDRWYTAHVSRVGGEGSKLFAVIFDDITDRKKLELATQRQEANMAFLNDISQELARLAGIEETMAAIGAKIGMHFKVDCCHYGEIDEQALTAVITHEWHVEGLSDIADGRVYNLPDLISEDLLNAARNSEMIVVSDVQNDRRIYDKAFWPRDVRSFILAPYVRNGQWLSLMSVAHTAPRDWHQDEIAMMQELTSRIWTRLERGRLQQLVNDSEKRLRLATEAAEVATWEWNLSNDKVAWNDQHFRIFGLEPQDRPVTPELFFKHVHPADRERVDSLLRHALAANVDFNAEFRALRADGSERWMSGYGRVMEKNGDQPVLMCGTMYDVTSRRNAESALRASEERQRAILASAKDYAIVTLDLDRTVQSTNQGARDILGYTENEILGQPGDIFFTPEDREHHTFEDETEKAINLGRAENERWLLRQDGSRFYGSGVTTPLMDESGQATGLLMVMRDLTSQKQAEIALQEADRRKDEFLAMLAHELRNPMSTLRNGLSVLKITQQEGSESADVIAMMDRQTTHLVRMVDDLLDVSRVTQGKIQLRKERINLGELLKNTIQAIEPQFAASGRQLHCQNIQPDLFVEGDATRLAQVITNLLTNAIRYTGNDGQAWVSMRNENDEAVIRVSDNGIGLSPGQETAIFGLFVQADNSPSRSRGGLGIGLTLVKQLVGMHDGRVLAQSPGPGKGSKFSIYLPLQAQPANESSNPNPETPAKPVKTGVLLIDDLPDLANLTAMLLRHRGYAVDIRNSGRDGIEAVETIKPSVVLCDIGMPELDGYQTAERIRQGSWGSQVILVALSGYGQEEDKAQARKAGFDGHMTKPVSLDELERLLKTLRGTD